MKKEDIKKNTTESQKVFIENLPKPKRLWHEYIPIIIAVIALVISIYSAHLSRKEFIIKNRPYVYANSRANDEGTIDVKSILICCINAPAKIVKQEYSYMFYKKNEYGEEEIVKTIPLESSLTSNVLYPSEKTDTQIFFPYDFEEILAKDPNDRLRRKVRLDYKELSTKRKYYFEGYWDYNRKYNAWVTSNMFAD